MDPVNSIDYSEAAQKEAFQKTAHFKAELDDRLLCHHQLLAYPDGVGSTALLQMIGRAVADISLALHIKEPQ